MIDLSGARVFLVIASSAVTEARIHARDGSIPVDAGWTEVDTVTKAESYDFTGTAWDDCVFRLYTTRLKYSTLTAEEWRGLAVRALG